MRLKHVLTRKTVERKMLSVETTARLNVARNKVKMVNKITDSNKHEAKLENGSGFEKFSVDIDQFPEGNY